MPAPSPRDLLDRLVLLRGAEARARALGDGPREAVRARVAAADVRASAARVLSDPMYAPAALSLLREALAHLVDAHEAAAGEPSLDASPPLARLDALVASGAVPPLPPWLAAGRAALAKGGGLAAEGATDATDGADVVEAAALVRWLRRGVDPRTPGEIRRSRLARLALLAALAVGALVLVVVELTSPPNVALHRPVRTSPLRSHSGNPEQATDGKLEATHAFITNVTDDAFAIVDLGKIAHVARVKVYPRGDSWFEETLPMIVELSPDATQWTEIGRFTQVFTQSDPQTARAAKLPARYVRVRVPGHKYLCLSEIEVYER